MSSARKLLLGTLAYAVVTFPLAYYWHLVLFADVYARLHFVTIPEPNVALGFFTILFQGALLGAAYPRVRGYGRPVRDGLLFGLAAGAFIWSAATVAHVAKHDVGDPAAFILLEGLYFFVDFAIYGVLIGLVHRGSRNPESRQAGRGMSTSEGTPSAVSTFR